MGPGIEQGAGLEAPGLMCSRNTNLYITWLFPRLGPNSADGEHSTPAQPIELRLPSGDNTLRSRADTDPDREIS